MGEALDKAIRVFCERGYHATSIGDLKDAMGLASGSIYKAFKDKRAVFMAALDRYTDIKNAQLKDTINTAQTGADRVRAALILYAKASYGESGRQGCIVVGCAAELATFDEDLAQWITTLLRKREALLYDLICAGQKDGSIPMHVNGKDCARLMLCLIHGMRVVGKTGRTLQQMTAVVEVAMKTLN